MPATRKKAQEITVSSDGWMSIPMAARALEISYTKVCAMALRGELETKTFVDRVFVRRESVDRILEKRNTPAGALAAAVAR